MWATNYTLRPAILRRFAGEWNERSKMVIFWTDSHCYTSSSRFIPAGYRTKAFKGAPAILGCTAGHHWSILIRVFVMFDAVEMHIRFEVRATKWVPVRFRIDFWWLLVVYFLWRSTFHPVAKACKSIFTMFLFCIYHGNITTLTYNIYNIYQMF